MEQTQENKRGRFSFLLYDENGLPKYFSINKILLKSLIYGLPTLTLVCLFIVMGFFIYFKQIRTTVIRKEPKIIKDLRQKNLELSNKAIKLEGLVDNLVQKTANTNVDNLELGQLMLFNPPAGFKDKTRTPIFSIEESSLIREKNKVLLRFNIVNQTRNAEKKAGHVFVILKTKGIYHIYPEIKTNSNDMNISFNSGESFATTKFRPVTAVFKTTQKSSSLLFKILIFSRSGDLLHKHFLTSESLEK